MHSWLVSYKLRTECCTLNCTYKSDLQRQSHKCRSWAKLQDLHKPGIRTSLEGIIDFVLNLWWFCSRHKLEESQSSWELIKQSKTLFCLTSDLPSLAASAALGVWACPFVHQWKDSIPREWKKSIRVVFWLFTLLKGRNSNTKEYCLLLLGLVNKCLDCNFVLSTEVLKFWHKPKKRVPVLFHSDNSLYVILGQWT